MSTTDTNPTQDDGKRYAHEIAPEPTDGMDAPEDVEPYLRCLLARTHAFQIGMRGAISRGYDTERVRSAVDRYIGSAYPALLMLRHMAGDTPGQAARYAHLALCSGDLAAEVLWDALQARGVDPNSIRGYGLPETFAGEVTA